MIHAIRVHEHGGPEKLVWEEIPKPGPKPGEALVRHEAVGLNYIDVYFRTGLYKAPSMPVIIGMEGAGVVEAVGQGVSDVKPGDRVAYAGALGAYAEARSVPAEKLVKIPDGVDATQAAAMMLQGMTAQFLIRRCHRVEKGETILVHAAAGGVGLILCQWAKHLGATVIGVVSTPEKAELVRARGAEHALLTSEDIPARVKQITGGAMVPVVYDSVGRDTFMTSLDCLKPFGLMVSFGNASGPVPPVPLTALKGMLYLTRPSLMPYTARREDLEATAGELIEMVQSGQVEIRIDQRYPLAEAAAAHRELESRRTTGSTLLMP